MGLREDGLFGQDLLLRVEGSYGDFVLSTSRWMKAVWDGPFEGECVVGSIYPVQVEASVAAK
jgi:hypothetical protein